jgi:ATP-dependent Clp protease ATP-binding subunit ClpA
MTALNFSKQTEEMLALARKEAERLNHSFVGTEHLLLALIRPGRATGFKILARLSVDPDEVRRETEKQVGRGLPQKIIGNMPYPPRVRKVLALGAKEAKAMEHSYVGTEHVLLALLLEGGGVAGRVLSNLRIETKRVRDEILQDSGAEDRGTISETAIGGSVGTNFGPSLMEQGSLTPRTQQALALAREEAAQFNHAFVSTEHVLLGLIRLGAGVAVRVLLKLGLDLPTVRAEIERHGGTGPRQENPLAIPYTWPVSRVLAVAHKEAEALHHTYIGTEHLLLGLLQEGEGICGRVFKNLKVDVEKTRTEIMRELDPKRP